MRGVGVPGGPRAHGASGRGNRAKQAEYRQSDAGRLARKMRAMDPEKKARRKAYRDARAHMAGHH